MAVQAEIQTVQIQIDGIDLAVPKGEMIIESAKRLGIEIPVFCYHPRMKPVGMCRMCLVEVATKAPDGSIRKMPKPQASCTLPASEGLIVTTYSEMVHHDRRGVLEFLLVNHPLDCPICDQGGECPLQNNTQFYGPSTSRFVELKRHLPKAFPLSDYVTLDLERCIQCGRCVRFTEEISGDGQLAFRFRGASMVPSTYELSTFDSKFSGNTIEICPVGALTSTKSRFRARPWDLETEPGICLLCSNGCNVWMDHRAGSFARIMGRVHEGINEEWTCDKGKFGHDFYNHSGRIERVFIRNEDQLEQSDWPTATEEILGKFKEKGKAAAMLLSGDLSIESLYTAKQLMDEVVESENVDFRVQSNLKNWSKLKSPQTIESLEAEKAILVFGTCLEESLPIVYLRVRKAWFKHGAKVIVASDRPSDADSYANLILRYKPGSAQTLAKGLAGSINLKEASSVTGIDETLLAEAKKVCEENQAAVVSTWEIYENESDGIDVDLESLAASFKSKASIYGLRANDCGAIALGIGTDSSGLNTREILLACARGTIKALWIVGFDPFEQIKDRDLVRRALESVDYLVIQSMLASESVNYASVVLPLCGNAETEGTFVNCEGRVQIQKPVLKIPGEAKPAWSFFSDALTRSGKAVGYFAPRDIFQTVSEQNHLFKGIGYSDSELIPISGLGEFLRFPSDGSSPNEKHLEQPEVAR